MCCCSRGFAQGVAPDKRKASTAVIFAQEATALRRVFCDEGVDISAKMQEVGVPAEAKCMTLWLRSHWPFLGVVLQLLDFLTKVTSGQPKVGDTLSRVLSQCYHNFTLGKRCACWVCEVPMSCVDWSQRSRD